MEQPIIDFQNITKHYNDNLVLKGIDFELEKGKFYTLLGPSGCGKTTILRIIAGFTHPSSGEVIMNNKRLNNVPPNQRPVNTVFQDYALFPHMNVFDNIAFPLKLKQVPEAEITERVHEMLKLVRLEGFENREVTEMSGGQKQRVGIARALISKPDVLLLDEPLSALDLKLRTEMQYELRALQQQLGITFVFVTHDQEEALAMSDWIFVMNDGEIMQSGTPLDIYDEPLNRFVAEFVGQSNIIEGRMLADYVVEFNRQVFDCVDAGMRENEVVDVVIRPEDLHLTTQDNGKIQMTITAVLFRGVHYEINGTDEYDQEWLVHSTLKAKVGEVVGLDFGPEDVHIMRHDESEKDFDERLESYQNEVNHE